MVSAERRALRATQPRLCQVSACIAFGFVFPVQPWGDNEDAYSSHIGNNAPVRHVDYALCRAPARHCLQPEMQW